MSEREPISEHEFLTVDEAAVIARVSPWTMRKWCRLGEIEAARLGASGYRIRRDVLQRALREGLRSDTGDIHAGERE